MIYDDGILGLRGSYLGVALRAGGIGLGGAGGGAFQTGALGGFGGRLASTKAQSYETRRIETALGRPRNELIDSDDRNFFIPEAAVLRALLRKRWYGCSLTIETDADPGGRRFAWKPALNDFSHVEETVKATFGERVARA